MEAQKGSRYSRKHRPQRIFFVLCTSSVLLLRPDCLVSAICPYCTTHTTQTPMPPAGFEPATPASDRPQTLALDRSATGISSPEVTTQSELHRPISLVRYQTWVSVQPTDRKDLTANRKMSLSETEFRSCVCNQSLYLMNYAGFLVFHVVTLLSIRRKRYDKESMQLFGCLDILPLIRISRLNWIGYVNRMDSK